MKIDKLKKKAVNICFTQSIWADATKLAQEKGLSLSSYINLLLAEQIKMAQKEDIKG